MSEIKPLQGTARRIDPAPLERSLQAVERMRIELGTTPAELVASEVQRAREALMEGMKLADRLGTPEEHRQVAERVLSIDDLLVWLSERSAS